MERARWRGGQMESGWIRRGGNNGRGREGWSGLGGGEDRWKADG